MNKKNKKNKNMQSFLKDSIIYIPSKIIEGLMGIIGLIYYTRWFVPEEYGDFSLIITGIGLSTTFLLGWLSQSSLRYYGNNQKNQEFISTIIFLIIGMNALFIIISVVAMFYIPLVNKYYLYIVFLFILSGMWLVLQSMLRAARKAYIYSTLISFSQILKFILTLILVKFFNVGIQSLFISAILFDIILVVVSIRSLRLFKFFKFGISSKLIKDISNYGVPLVGVALISWVLQSSDRIMLGIMKGSKDVGMYTVAYTIVSQPFSLILTSIMISAFPILISVWEKEGKSETEETITGILRYFFMLIIPAILGLIFLKEEIFKQMVGNEYFEANKILPWVSLGLLFMGLTQYTNKIWELTERTKMILILTSIAGVTNILLNLYFIPKIGYEGAAITTLIAYGVYYLISTILGKKYLSIHFNYRSLIKVIVSSSIMVITIILTKHWITSILTLLVMILLYSFVYLLLLWLLNEVRTEFKSIQLKFKK